MSNNTYFIEHAKSNRSQCKKCKEKIAKDEIRIVVEIPGESYSTNQSFHPLCYSLPRKLSTGANKITVEEFVADILEDRSDGEILPAKADQIVELIKSKPAKQEAESLVSKLKAAWQKRMDDSKEPPAKKTKTEDGVSDRAIELYGEYHKFKNDDLKDILGWNRQVKTGNKDFMLAKVIDGCMYGRLSRCMMCGGRLKMNDHGKIVCSGTFDEDTQTRADCAYTATPEEAPRHQPWFTQAPSEEQEEEMDRLDAEAKGESEPTAPKDDLEQLTAAAEKFEWNLKSRDGLKAATTAMVTLLQDHDGKKKIDMPADNTAQQKVGQIIAANRDKSAAEIIPLIIQEFGFVEDKQAAAEKKEAAIATITKHSANAALVKAFQELADLYFKSGNANAGKTYKKVVAALGNVDFEITEENAMGLGKGKTKIEGIGKGSAEKIYEYVTTGTMAKLEEKRADVA